MTGTTDLTPDNISQKAAALRNGVRQWTGGIAIMAQAKAGAAAGDPLSGILE